MKCFDGLGGFGGFCGVLIALGAISNVAPSTYVAALSIQTLGRYVRNIPRWVLCLFLTCVELACSVAGRNSLYGIFENFLPIMAYWVCPWLTIVIEEHVLFHKLRGVPFDWSIWEDSKKLPFGAAAMLAWVSEKTQPDASAEALKAFLTHFETARWMGGSHNRHGPSLVHWTYCDQDRWLRWRCRRLAFDRLCRTCLPTVEDDRVESCRAMNRLARRIDQMQSYFLSTSSP